MNIEMNMDMDTDIRSQMASMLSSSQFNMLEKSLQRKAVNYIMYLQTCAVIYETQVTGKEIGFETLKLMRRSL
jgi:hypothetical protein